jgi:hypothetical protein
MHTSFEGKIYRMGKDGKPMWERPRTPREAGTSRILTALVIAAIATTVPLAVVLGILLARM